MAFRKWQIDVLLSAVGRGASFSRVVRVDGRDIDCDDKVIPRNECCISRRKHLTCYSMM